MNAIHPIELHIAGLGTELSMLLGAVLLGIFQLMIAARAVNGERGVKWNVGPRDEPGKAVSATAGRLERASRNFMETFPFFAVLVIIATFTSRPDWATG